MTLPEAREPFGTIFSPGGILSDTEQTVEDPLHRKKKKGANR
jgi:hypothetical protein